MALTSGNLPHAEIDSVARNDFNDAMTQLDSAFPLQTADIDNLQVTEAKIAALAVTAAKLAADAVETAKIKDLNVTDAKIAALAVTAAKLAADAVETAKIKDLQVTAAKLATDAVETAKIKDLQVTAAKLAADAVETAKIKDANVTSPKLDALNKGRFENALLHVQDQKASGSYGGTSAARTWNIRDLNTVLTNEIPGASLDSNQITLPAGTYFITASAPCDKVDYHKLKLYNVTDSSDILIGTANYTTSSYDIVTRSVVTGRFTLAAQKTLELRHYTHNAIVNNGLGIAAGAEVVEVYSDVMIWMI